MQLQQLLAKKAYEQFKVHLLVVHFGQKIGPTAALKTLELMEKNKIG